MPTESGQPRRIFEFADLVLDAGRRQVLRGDTVVELTGKSFEVLHALVGAAPDSVSHDQLMDAVWRGSVVSQTTVAKRIELVRQALGDDSAAPRYIALVRGYGYRLIPDVTIVDRPDAAIPKRGRLWAVAVIAALAVAAGLSTMMLRPPAEPPEQSIAVLPFVSLSDDPGDQLFADGLTEELSHALASDARLKVAGRISAFRFRDRTQDAQAIGETLGVAHLLEGSVRRSGDQLRITATLTETSDGFSLWSTSYDREISDIIDIQRDIARNVAGKMRATLRPNRHKSMADASVIDPPTYALYLRAVSLSPYGALHELGEAQELIETVTERAPAFAPGWNRLAAIHGRRLFGRDPGYDRSPDEAMSIMLSAVARALAIDPDSAEAYAGLGGAAWVFEGDAKKAAPLIERAVTLDPYDLDIISFAAEFAKFIGRLDEAMALEEMIVARDPLCDFCRSRLAKSYQFAGRAEDAAREYETLRSMYEGHHWNYGITLLMLGRADEALASFRQMQDFEHLRLQGEAAAECALGERGAADATLATLADIWAEQHPQEVAKAMAFCNRLDTAFDLLEQSLPAGAVQLQTEHLSPFYERLRDDPRWSDLLRRIGRTREQVDAIPFSLEAARAAVFNSP